MQKQFTQEYITENKGCYEADQLEALFQAVGQTPTLKQLYDYLPIKDFCWFLVRKCGLTNSEKVNFAIGCALHVLPIYEDKYPEDKRVRNCIEATKKFIKGDISLEQLTEARAAAAYAADAAAYAAYAAAAYAAYAAAAYAAAYAADAAAYAADAAAAADAAKFKEFVWVFIETLD